MKIKSYGPIVPRNEKDPYPIVKASDIQGGFRSVETFADLNKIPIQRQERGMHVFINETSRLYMNTSPGKGWIEKQVLKTINGKAPNEDGELIITFADIAPDPITHERIVDVDEVKTIFLNAERINVDHSGIQNTADNGRVSNLISGSYGGDGPLIGSGLGDCAINVLNEALVIKSNGIPKEIRSDTRTFEGRSSSIDGNGENVVSWKYIFDGDHEIFDVGFWPGNSTTKARVEIRGVDGELLAYSATVNQYKSKFYSVGLSESSQTDQPQVFSMITPFIVSSGIPIQITVLSDEEFSLASGISLNTDLKRVKCVFSGERTTKGVIEHTGISKRGSISKDHIFLTDQSLKIVSDSKVQITPESVEGIKYPPLSKTLEGELLFNNGTYPTGLILKSLSIMFHESSDIAGVYALLSITYDGVTEVYPSHPIKQDAEELTESLIVDVDMVETIYIRDGSEVSFKLHSVSDGAFSVGVGTNGFGILMLGNKPYITEAGGKTIKTFEPVIYPADESGIQSREMAIIYSDGSKSESIDFTRWFTS